MADSPRRWLGVVRPSRRSSGRRSRRPPIRPPACQHSSFENSSWLKSMGVLGSSDDRPVVCEPCRMNSFVATSGSASRRTTGSRGCGEGTAGCCIHGRQRASPAGPQNGRACHSRSEPPGNRSPDTAAQRERVSALYSYFPQEISMLRGYAKTVVNSGFLPLVFAVALHRRRTVLADRRPGNDGSRRSSSRDSTEPRGRNCRL